ISLSQEERVKSFPYLGHIMPSFSASSPLDRSTCRGDGLFSLLVSQYKHDFSGKGFVMSTTLSCSKCHQLMPAEAHICPHCGTPLYTPNHGPDALPQIPHTPPTSPHASPLALLSEPLPDVLKQL